MQFYKLCREWGGEGLLNKSALNVASIPELVLYFVCLYIKINNSNPYGFEQILEYPLFLKTINIF